MSASPPVILVLTVGGSRQPLETAIRANDPVELLLVASDGAGGQASSRDDARSLADSFRSSSADRGARVIEVPADDLAAAFARVGAALDSLARTRPGARIVANYTGGTKGMSTALLMAAFRRGLETQLTTGARADLRQVTAGTETIQAIDTRLIALETELDIALGVGARGDYGAAELLIDGLLDRAREGGLMRGALAKRLTESYGWSRCLAAWDRFEHKTAMALLAGAERENAPWVVAMAANGHRAILAELARGKDDPSVALCQDLLENARRREAQGRFDDALARLYRFVEACVQTQLFRRWGLKSGELAEDDVPLPLREGQRRVMNKRGDRQVYQLPLDRTVRLLRHRDGDDPVAAAYGVRGPAWLSKRNRSILAHGYAPIGGEVVKGAFAWIDETLVPAMGLTPLRPFPGQPN